MIECLPKQNLTLEKQTELADSIFKKLIVEECTPEDALCIISSIKGDIIGIIEANNIKRKGTSISILLSQKDEF